MKVAALQYDSIWEDPAANFARLVRWIDTAVAAGTQLLVLPEMFACGFSMNVGLVAEAVEGPTTRFLRDQARRTGLWIGGSLPEASPDPGRPHNTFVLVAPDGQLVRYHKIHPFSLAGEDQYYRPGSACTTVEIDGLRCTLFVCYDLRFADLFWETASHTDCYLVVANWPEPRRDHWRTLLRARAIENQAYVVGVNRVGTADGLTYAGDSAIIGPNGEALAEGGRQEGLVSATVVAEEVHRVREALPFLLDRRPRASERD